MRLLKIIYVVIIIAIAGCSDNNSGKGNPYKRTENPEGWGADDLRVPQK